jgi:hypothetical protein
MKVNINLNDVESIHNCGEFGTVLRLTEEPHEHVNVSFLDVLKTYCEAVDAGADGMELDDKPIKGTIHGEP